MKVGIAFNVSGVNAFEPISKVNCLTVALDERHRLMINKRRLVGTAEGINIGAVRFPEYSNESNEIDYRPFIDPDKRVTNKTIDIEIDTAKRALAMYEVCPHKSAWHTFKCVNVAGVVSQVLFDKDKKAYRAASGAYFRPEDVTTLFYDSEALTHQIALKNAGKALTIPEAYFDWMVSNQTNKLIIDVSLEIGKQMRYVINEVYNGSLTPTSSLLLPSFFFHNPNDPNYSYKKGVVEAFIVKMARSQDGILSDEYVPHKGVVREIEFSDDKTAVGITIQRVEVITSSETGPIKTSNTKYRVLDKYTNIELPNIPGKTEILVEKVNCEVGDILDIGSIVTRTSRMIRLLPYQPALTDYPALAETIETYMVEYLQTAIMKQHTPNINGSPAIALDFLDKLPEVFNPSIAFYVRNQPLNYVFDGPKSALVGSRPCHVKFDMLRHPWFKTTDQARASNQFDGRRDKPLRMGDMIIAGSGSNMVQ